MYLGGWVGFKQGRETEKKDKQRERVNKWKEKRKKTDISFSFYIFYFGDSGEKKTFTANFAQSGENSVDHVFKNSVIYTTTLK